MVYAMALRDFAFSVSSSRNCTRTHSPILGFAFLSEHLLYLGCVFWVWEEASVLANNNVSSSLWSVTSSELGVTEHSQMVSCGPLQTLKMMAFQQRSYEECFCTLTKIHLSHCVPNLSACFQSILLRVRLNRLTILSYLGTPQHSTWLFPTWNKHPTSNEITNLYLYQSTLLLEHHKMESLMLPTVPVSLLSSGTANTMCHLVK